MSLQVIKNDLSNLPKLFSDGSGHPNSQLLKAMCATVSKAGKHIRELLASCSTLKISPSDDVYLKLAEVIYRKDFREKWYLETDAGRIKIPTLYNLAEHYVIPRYKYLDFNSPELKPFFSRRNVKGESLMFPVLEKIDILISQIVRVNEISLIDSAIYVWALIESVNWGAIRLPLESSLTDFEACVRGALKEAGNKDILDLLMPGSWREENSLPINLRKVANQSINLTSSRNCRPAVSEENIPKKHAVVISIEVRIRNLENTVLDYEKNRLLLVAKCGEIGNSAIPLQVINESVSLMENIKESLLSVLEIESKISSDVRAEIDDALEKINLKIDFKDIIVSCPGHIARSLADLNEILSQSSALFSMRDRLLEKSNEVQHKVALHCPLKTVEINNLTEALAEISDCIGLIENGVLAKNIFSRKINENYRNLDWDIFCDPTLTDDDWRNLGRLAILEKDIGIIIGIALRKEYFFLSKEFSKKLDVLIEDADGSSFEKLLLMFKYLTLGQIEGLCSESKNVRQFLAIIEAHAYLDMMTWAPVEAYSYWSANPLNEYATQPPEDIFGTFFHALFALCGDGVDSKFGLTELRFELSQVRSISHLDITGLGEQNLQRSLHVRLEEILRYYKRGGNTYAELWSRAYQSLFEPIRALLDESKYPEILQTIASLAANFEIDDHISRWKTSIPEHLRKRSEYDKHIRSQVRSKIDELVEWGKSYTAVNFIPDSNKPGSLVVLSDALEKVFGSSDSGCNLLKIWFDRILRGFNGFTLAPWCLSGSKESNLSLIVVSDNITAFYPRSYQHSNATFADIFSDELISSFGCNSTIQLATNYADLGLYEEFFALTAGSVDGIPPDLDRRVETEVDELEHKQYQRIVMLESKQESLVGSAEDIDLYILELRKFLTEKSWKKLDTELMEVEVLVLNFEAKKIEKQARDALCLDIARLGGSAPNHFEKNELEVLFSKLYQQSMSRRRHIEPLRHFLNIESMDSDVVAAANYAINSLELAHQLPDEAQSEYISYVLEQAVRPLADELRRHRTLLPAYSAKLKSLTLALLSNIQQSNFLVGESSSLLGLLEASADVWKDLARSGEDGVDILCKKFKTDNVESIAYSGNIDSPEEIRTSSFAAPIRIGKTPEFNGDAIVGRLIQKMRSSAGKKVNSGRILLANEALLHQEVKNSNWADAAEISSRLFLDAGGGSSLKSKDAVANWAICSYLSQPSSFEKESYAAMFQLINCCPSATAVRSILPTKSSKGLVGELAVRFLKKIAVAMEPKIEKASVADQLNLISSGIILYSQYRLFIEIAFSPVGESGSIVSRGFWDHFSGDTRQAEVRAAFMNMLWKSSAPSALACCLTYNPIEISRRKADALAKISNQALETGKFELLQSFIDLKKTNSSKPFQLFVDLMLSLVPNQIEQSAQLMIVGRLEQTINPIGLKGLLSITPRKSDCPDTILIKLSSHSSLRFIDGTSELLLMGPFFEPTLRNIEFSILTNEASIFGVDVTCEATSITGKVSKFSSNFNINFSDTDSFKGLSPDDLEDAYGSFPEYQMRGSEYVPRLEDERKIERSLFNSKTIRSLWISSPRRSGKTTMLYRILDAYSHKVGRDNVVVYLTLDKSFSNSADFNSWLWTRLRTIPANKELRDLYCNFDELGKNLPWTADAGTFVGELADKLMSARTSVSRIVFLIDEVDKFASMYYENGARRDAATEIMWQIRQLIGERRDIGFVFAGSSAAKRIFVTNSDAPFFNGITLLDLTPFSSRTNKEENSARAIIAPGKVAVVHTIPKDTLDHLLWVCAGIPYYMKLVAGATMAVAKQSHILISDVNDGLRSLLLRSTGVPRLDDMGGDPGSDELRTMAIETGEEKLLTLAVLYSIAETYSPLGGHPILRANITASDSPMVSRYHLPRKKIERGLELCIELGLLKSSIDQYSEIEFSIPILGESIRNACGRLWSNIDHELRMIVESENK